MLDALDAMPGVKAWFGSRRDLLGDVLHALFGVDSGAILSDESRAALRKALDSGFNSGAQSIGRPDLEWVKARLDAATEKQLGQMVSRVDAATRNRIGDIVREVLDGGGTIADLQARIQIDEAFSPVRSLRIARTETTRATNAGSSAAWQDVADNEGLVVRRRWLAELDGATREAHRLLSGQERGIREDFEVPSGDYAGARGRGPGEFADPGMVVNCRCTTVPLVSE